MFKIAILLFVVIATCHADPEVTCGEMPPQIYSCLGNPPIIARDVVNRCLKFENPCDRNKCIFEILGWMTGTTINKEAYITYFDKLATDLPEWTTAVNHMKTACLSKPLPPQGSYLDCPAYDITLCTISTFFKNTQPSQWANREDCVYPKQYAASCPVCPKDCFVTPVPAGSCHACQA